MEINNNEWILPNISLGYVMVDGCNRDIVALARSFSFIPDKNTSVWSLYKHSGARVEDCGRHIKTYPVVGMIGPSNSRAAVMIAPILRYEIKNAKGAFIIYDKEGWRNWRGV